MKPFLYWSPLSDALSELRRIYLSGKKLRAKENARCAIDHDNVGSNSVALFSSGLAFFVVCFPLLLIFSDSPMQSFFFLDLRDNLLSSYHPIDYLHTLIESGNISTVLAALCLYGLTGIVTAFVTVSGGLIRLVIVANGLYFGYGLTALVNNLLFLGPPIHFSALNVAYLFLAYYLAHAMTQLIGGSSYGKEKYAHLFSGLQGLFAGWLLSKGYGSSAIVLSGALYLVCSFVCMIVAEFLFLPWCYTLKAWAKTADADIEWFDNDPNIRLIDLFRAAAEVWRSNTKECLIFTAFYLAWPAVIAILFVAIYSI